MKTKSSSGFTLIELMIVVAIMAVLVAIGIPSYSSYVLKGKLTEGQTLLSDLQLREEQYYADNRAYADGMTPRTAGKYFTNTSCVTSSANQSYICTARMTSPSYSYTVNDGGAKTTTKPDNSTASCWLTSDSGTC
jgi:type IV pilus assembly protein PilE